jgi:chromosome segregation ATPase
MDETALKQIVALRGQGLLKFEDATTDGLVSLADGLRAERDEWRSRAAKINDECLAWERDSKRNSAGWKMASTEVDRLYGSCDQLKKEVKALQDSKIGLLEEARRWKQKYLELEEAREGQCIAAVKETFKRLRKAKQPFDEET